MAQYSAGPRRSALRRRRPDEQDMAVPSAPLPNAHAHCANPPPPRSRPLRTRTFPHTRPSQVPRLPPAHAPFATNPAFAHACPTPPCLLRPPLMVHFLAVRLRMRCMTRSPLTSYLTIWQGATPVAAPFKLPAEKRGGGMVDLGWSLTSQ